MAGREHQRTRYLVLPGQGIAGAAMESALFKDEAQGGASLLKLLSKQLNRFAPADYSVLAATAPAAHEALAATVEETDFEVVSQRFPDGPAVCMMTPAARLALEASNPDVRVVPITNYYLPGTKPKRGKQDDSQTGPASQPAAINAVQANGTVFTADARQHFLGNGGLVPGVGDGTGVRVAVIDTGVDSQHPALQGQVPTLRCFIPGVPAGAGGPVDWGPGAATRAAHGTHVAGIIAARGGHGGPEGVAPGATLISFRVFPDNPDGPRPAQNPAIIDSIRGAIAAQCHIVNLSLEGGALKEDGVRSAIADAWNNGVLCIAAAGNGFGLPVSYPAALPHCVAVTAVGRVGAFPNLPELNKFVSQDRASTDQDIFLASFSNFGPQVQFTAPGHAIVSTFPNGQWWFDSGTSMAAPFVSGMLARLLSGNHNILNATGDAARSSAMLQMLVGRAHLLGLPQQSQEGYGLPG